MMHNTTHTSLIRRPWRRPSHWLVTAGRVLKVLPLAVALCFGPVIRAQINPLVAGLPRGGTVATGSASVAGSLSSDQLTLTLTQTGGNRSVIDWQSFNIDAGRTVQFVQPSASAAVLNRVPTGGLSEIGGTLTANGLVLLMNPNGVLFKSGASINVGSLIATTGSVNQTTFMAGGNFGITGANGNSVVNQGTITATGAGLVALVAPSVSNQGSITATGGRIALSGADLATITLNGGLYEFAVSNGAVGTNATVTNAATARLDGASLLLSTGDAAALVSGVVNLQGVQQASSAIVVNGNTVVLTSDLNATTISGNSNSIQVQAGASIQDAVKIAKTGTPGAGATVEVQAGTFSEQLTLNKANLTLSGQTGARLAVPDEAQVNGIAISAHNVTVQGLEIAGPLNAPYHDYYATPKSNISRGIAVSDGITGFTLRDNNIHDVRNGILIHGRNSTGTISNNTIENTKSGISVQYTDAAGITIAGNREGPIGNEWGLNLHLNGHLVGSTIVGNTPPIDAAPTTAWQQSLLNLSTNNNGWAVQDQGYTAANRTQATVATSGAAGNQGSRLAPINTVQGGINAVVAGGRVTVQAGTYAEAPTISRALTLQGDTSISRPLIELPAGTSGTLTVQASNVTVQGMQLSKLDQAADTALVTIPRGGSFPNYTIAHSNIRLNDLVFSKGRRGAFITGQNITVENSSFGEQLRDALYFDAVAGTTTIRNNQFSGAAGSKKAILIEGFTGIPASSGTVNVTGNTLNGKDNFFVYNAWTTPASRVSLNLTNNKITSTSDNGIALYDPRVDGGSIDPASFAKISSMVVSGNDLSGVPAGKYAVVGISDASYPVAVNASGNWWGSSNPAAVTVSGPVDYTPMLATGTDTSASTPGFQGDTTALIVHAQGQQSGSTARIQEGINLVQAGGTVHVAAGSYAQPSTLSVGKSLTLAGAGEAATTIDARGIASGYGLSISADDVTLRDLTVQGPSAFYASAYGIKVSPGGGADARLRNFTISKVSSRGAGKAELDLNGVDGALIDQVTLNGAPVGNDSGSTQGAGLQLTDSANVTVRDTTTLNNSWGGVAIYQANRSYNQQANNIRIEASNRFHEANPVYLQDESALRDFGHLEISGFGYAVRNSDSASSRQYTWLQASPQQAYDHAVNLAGAGASTIQGWDGSATTQAFHVGVGNLTGGGSQAMSIATAVNQAAGGATVNVGAGTYAENVSITKALTLKGAGAGQSIIDPASDSAVRISGNMGAGATLLIDGFTFRDAPAAGVSVAGDTVLGQLTIQNSDFRGNGAHGFTADGAATGGIPGLANVSLLNSTFEGNGAPHTSATALAQGDIHFDYYNGNATLRNLSITGNTEPTGIHLRGYHDAATGAVHDTGTWVFDNITLAGSFRRPGGAAGTVNPNGPGRAIHIAEYGSVANVSFKDVKVNPTLGHGLVLEGLGSTVDLGNTTFGVPDRTVTGEGSAPTLSMNIVTDVNTQNNVKTHVDATHATFTGAGSGFDIEDRVGHALDKADAGLVTWSAGNFYVTPASASVQRGVDAAGAGHTVHIAAGTYAQPSTLRVDKSLTLAGAGQALTTIDARGVSGDAGMRVSADHVTLWDFTFHGPVADADSAVGIQVAPIGPASARLLDVSLGQVTSRGAGRAELELNGVNGAVLDAVTLDGAPVAGGADTPGSGLHVLDSANVTLRHSSTRNNADGGVAIHQANLVHDQQVSGITIEGNNAFGEANPVFLRDASASQNLGAVSTAGLDYAVGNAGTAESGQYTWLQATQQKAMDHAVNLPNPGSSYVQGWTGAQTTQNFQVGIGQLAGGGTRAMSIGAALDQAASGASIDVSAGSYPETVTVSRRHNLRFNDATVHGLTLQAGASDTGISGKVSADTAAGLVFQAPISLQGDTTLATHGAGIVLNQHVQNAGSTPYALTLTAGTGGSRGDVSMTSGGSAGNPLGLLTVSSRRFTLADTLWVLGYRIDALGDVALSNHTLNASDAARTNTLTSGGDVTGATTSKGSVEVVSGGDVQANVTTDGAATVIATNIGGSITSKGNVDLAGTGNVSAAVTTDGAAKVTATDIGGSITSKGNVDLAGTGNVSAAVTTDGAAKVTATDIGGSITSKGNVDLAGTGNVSAAVTTDGAAKVTATNISGSIASKGNVELQGSGDVAATVAADGGATVSARNVSGTISGRDVAVSAQETVDVAVTAANTATLAGGNVQGSVSAQSATVQSDSNVQMSFDTTAVNVRAEGTVNLSGSAANVSIDAPHGSVSGDFGQVSNAGSGVFSVNGKPELNPVLNANTENNRVIPARLTAADRAASEPVAVSRPPLAVASSRLRTARIERSAPAAAGTALYQGQAVEIDLAPSNEGEQD